MPRSRSLLSLVGATTALILGSCSSPLPWPESPLYVFPETDPEWRGPDSLEAAMAAIEGHYAHYDVVAYEDVTTRTPMRTFIISYGFTDFEIREGRLYQIDRFCHAEQKLSQRNATSTFSDEATQAIEPREQEVELRFKDGQWQVFRPASPTLLGIAGDPSQPLSTDPEDPNITDPDGDGNPGVTVRIAIGSFLDGEIYITRREVYRDYLTLNSNGNLYGHVEDDSEQFVIGASLRVLAQPSNAVQVADPGMNPVILVRINDGLDSCGELMENRDLLFPEEPGFR
jgi:hypothetical protein